MTFSSSYAVVNLRKADFTKIAHTLNTSHRVLQMYVNTREMLFKMRILSNEGEKITRRSLFLFMGIGCHLVDKSNTAPPLCFHSDSF